MIPTPLRHGAEDLSGRLFDLLGGAWHHAGMRFDVPAALTRRGFRGRFLPGLYELPERRLLRHLPPDSTLLELGGCLGVVACLAGRRLRDPARHVVVEANPDLIPVLEANRDRNGGGFAVRHGMVGGTGEFWRGGNIVAGSAHRPRGEAIRVPVLSMAGIEAERGLRFDAAIVDIEGGEAEFAAAHADWLRRARFVLVEFHPRFIGGAACEATRAAFARAGLRRAGRFMDAEAWVRPGGQPRS